MELTERGDFLEQLHSQFENIKYEEGHTIFVSGEAGIGKTSLVKTFCKELKDKCTIYQGICDALFTPRPLSPVYDILLQMRNGVPGNTSDITDRTAFFTSVFHELKMQKEASVVIFEDIHWADEATLDFIKFLTRRITQLHCLFILTYRDNEIHAHHPLRNVLGQLNPESFTRLQLPPLSKEAVEKMAAEKGYNGEDVYKISGGNPFYVNEILASYSPGIPDNIRDSIVSVYNLLDEKTKSVWNILSVFPAGLEAHHLEKLVPSYGPAIQNCIKFKILIHDNERLFFKHELYRRTIETSLSPLIRVELNKHILVTFREIFEREGKIEQLIHHAKNANDYDAVIYYAPDAGRKAASIGAHIEASRLFLTAIEYYQGHDEDLLIQFYESYAYECYLTNQLKEAIIYIGKSLNLWKKKNNTEKMGDNMRFLSRLWWWDGNRKKAENFGEEAIEVLEKQPTSRAKAMAYSNMSHLKMLSDQPAECIFWGEKAIKMAKEAGDQEILSHALNNVGDIQVRIPSSQQKGIQLLQQSLEIALKNSYHEHVARAYTNLAHNGMLIKDYELAKDAWETGIQYCEERDLDSWTVYMLSGKAKLNLETGKWDEAFIIATNLIKNETLPTVVKIGALTVLATIRMRRGDTDVLPLLNEAKEKAFETMELQRIIPVLVALLEFEWITGESAIDKETIDSTISMVEKMGNIYENSEFAFWMLKARKQSIPLTEFYEGYDMNNQAAATIWEKAGCRYQQAFALFAGNDNAKREAIAMIHELGAHAVFEKMKFEMRSSGIKSIPRGVRKTTQSNPALLTDRELDVLKLLQEGLQNKEIAARLFISAKTVDHHISSILYKLEVKSRTKAVHEATRLGILK
jgi:DNA-binding CsgD family transcriptional regulator